MNRDTTDNPVERSEPKETTREGGKTDWGRTVDSVPTSEEDDPKQNEPRKGDMSTREGDPGKRAPR